MKTIRKLITNEFIDRIENKLNEEMKLMQENEIDSTIYDDYNEIDTLVIADIVTDYLQIPLFELEEYIRETYPFVDELGINIIPNIECYYKESFQIARASVTHFYSSANLDFLTDSQYKSFQQLLEELIEIYDEIRIGVKVEFESLESNEYGEEYLRVIDIYEGW